MPDKLTDKEIVKALRSWLEEIRKSRQAYLDKVNVEHYPSMRYEYLLSDTINEINRLKAENKRLSTLAKLGNTRANDYRVMRDRALKAEAENERLRDNLNAVLDERADHTEAYKEFAERLDNEFEGVGTCNYGYVRHKIRKVLKESVGE